MASLGNGWITEKALAKLLDECRAAGATGMPYTISIQDKSDQFGNNVELFYPQTDEQKAEKANRNIISKAKIFWTDGKVFKAVRPEKKDDNPF